MNLLLVLVFWYRYRYPVSWTVIINRHGLRLSCYMCGHNKVMRMDDPENPTIIEDLIRALGAEAVVYARRNECCGGYISVESPDAAKKNSNAIIENAKAQGAEMIITACPLCKYNLIKSGADIPVVYFTELLAEALGVKEDTDGE